MSNKIMSSTSTWRKKPGISIILIASSSLFLMFGMYSFFQSHPSSQFLLQGIFPTASAQSTGLGTNANALIQNPTESRFFEYQVQTDGTLVITKCSSKDDIIVVPLEIKGKRVTKIASYAIYTRPGMTVVLPEGILSLDYACFHPDPESDNFHDNWASPCVFYLPHSLTEMSGNPFVFVWADIYFPNGSAAFEYRDHSLIDLNNKALVHHYSDFDTEYIVPFMVETINDDALGYAPRIVLFPENSRLRVFYGYFELAWNTVYYYPAELHSYNDSEFFNNLESASIAYQDSTINPFKEGFYWFYSVSDSPYMTSRTPGMYNHIILGYRGIAPESMVLDSQDDEFSTEGDVGFIENLWGVGPFAFSRQNSMRSLRIIGDVKYIGFKAFYSCKNLKKVFLPDSVSYIGPEAFADCALLEQVVLPDNVSFIGKDAFRGVEHVTFIVKTGSYAEEWVQSAGAQYQTR